MGSFLLSICKLVLLLNQLNFKVFLVIGCLGSFLLSICKLVLLLNQLNFEVCFLRRYFCLLLMVLRNISLFRLNLFHESFLFLFNYLVFLQEFCFCVNLFLIHSVCSICLLFQETKFFFRVWCPNQRSGLLNDDKPSPVSESHILSEVTLSNLNELPLISFLLINLCFYVFVCLTLQHSQKLDDNVIPCFLKTSKGPSSEELKGMAKTISLTIKANLVHQGISSYLIIR